MSKNLSIEALRSHLFETLEGVKNLNDEQASPCEKITIEQAKAIVDISDSIIDTFKVQLEGVKLAQQVDSLEEPGRMLRQIGFESAGN